MSLAYKAFPVFRLKPPQDPSASKIADLRLIFTVADKLESIPAGAVPAKGATILESVTGNALVFLSRHPILDDVYYRKSVPIPHSYQDYLVATDNGHIPFYVTADGGHIKFLVNVVDDGSLYISGAGGYVIVDYTKTHWFIGETVEPFNVVFYPDLPAAETSTLVVRDQHGSSCTVDSNTRFTNTPQTPGGIIDTGYSFTLAGGAIGLTRETTPEIVVASDGPTIKSINGITPVGGNINIQVLS